MKLGRFQLALAPDGEFRLDGGAMFGVVPKVLWEKKKAPDERNRIRMTTNCLLVESGSELVLVDTGVGDKGDAKFIDQFAVGGERRLPEAIRAAGYELGDVTHVLLTHLHFDHCGWSTVVAEDGRLVPTFPRARYWLERGELAHARRPNLRDRASYDPRNWEPLFEAGVVELFEQAAEPIPGVRAEKVRGHNADMCVVLLDGGEGAKAGFWADLVPTAAHLPFPWIMSYDLYPMETLAAKEHWLPLAAREGWISLFEHDPELPAARLVEDDKGRLTVEPL
ncbi:MAG TPA: MBL fold metallo-hydrolase [Thermoanaerobaculia bacterium]|nr:MBL fold metallo-hydrolase [Thermoanaerobaculia bacterium]